jgi:tRNA threonylcarbamoyl adenosine modification protein YeaZ
VLLIVLDTSTAACTVVLADVGAGAVEPGAVGAGDAAGLAAGPPGAADRASPTVTVLASSVTVDARRHGEVLAPAIRAVLSEAGAVPGDLGAVAVGLGPGPFTSLRVGIVTAAALGSALDIAVHGLCSLDALAATAGGPTVPGLLGVATDARRREVYWAAYTGGELVAGPAVDHPDVAAARLADLAGQGELAGLAVPARVVGAGARLYAAAFGAAFDPAGPDVPAPAALARLAAGPALDGGTPGPLAPIYLRRPDAAEPRARRPVTA